MMGVGRTEIGVYSMLSGKVDPRIRKRRRTPEESDATYGREAEVRRYHREVEQLDWDIDGPNTMMRTVSLKVKY